MWKKFNRFLLKMFKNPFFKILFYLLLLLGVFAIAGAFSSDEGFFTYMKDLVTDQGTVAFFFAGIVTICVSTLIKHSEIRLEESMKIIDDHHQIICKYRGHTFGRLDLNKPYFYSEVGNFMELHNIRKNMKIKNPLKDKYSTEYKALAKEIEFYNEGILILPTVNVYTNISGECNLCFVDRNKFKELPPFIIGNGTEFLKAHLHSSTTNNVTIRLDNIKVDDSNNVTLHTSRTYYFHMLLTNRCMDYKLDCDMSVREIYEFKDTVSKLPESKLSNQIGINGMIITSDGYLLLEKRDHTKTTWKNKFAQPISLALKATDLNLTVDDIITTNEEGNELLINVLKKTMKENFGLLAEDYEEIVLSKNFLGMARDLLEGGKPNLYFYVVLKESSDVVLKKLERNASVGLVKDKVESKLKKQKVEKLASLEKNHKPKTSPLKTGKLTSQYFLIDYSDIKIDFNYALKVERKKVKRINRVLYPRCSKRQQAKDKRRYFISSLFHKYLEYECGEALLVTLSYLEICKKRIKPIQNKKVSQD